MGGRGHGHGQLWAAMTSKNEPKPTKNGKQGVSAVRALCIQRAALPGAGNAARCMHSARNAADEALLGSDGADSK